MLVEGQKETKNSAKLCLQIRVLGQHNIGYRHHSPVPSIVLSITIPPDDWSRRQHGDLGRVRVDRVLGGGGRGGEA